MKKTLSQFAKISLVVILTLSLSAPVWADLLTGEDSSMDAQLGGYVQDATGNQDWVREFDGRDFRGAAVEALNLSGYNGPYQYSLEAGDLGRRDHTVGISLGYKNLGSLNYGFDSLTHRLARIPSVNPYLGSYDMAGFSDPATPYGDAFYDYAAPDTQFGIYRKVNDLGLTLGPGNGKVSFIATGWWENERGAKQKLFYDRYPPPNTYKGRKAGTEFLVNRTTSEAAVGLDARITEGSALNYRRETVRFRDQGGYSGDTDPATVMYSPATRQTSDVFKARAKLGSRLQFTGVHINRTRSNRDAIHPLFPLTWANGSNPPTYENGGQFLNSQVGITSTNLGLTFAATDSLTLSGNWRDYEVENRVPAVFRTGQTVSSNPAMSHEEEALEFEATYTGIPRTFLRGGYERRTTDRTPSALHEEPFEGEYGISNEHTTSRIWRASARFNPTDRLSLSGKLEDWNIKNAAFTGTPNNRTLLNVDANYMVSDNFGLYANYNKLDEKNDTILIPVDEIPTPATDEDETKERIEAAGQGYENNQDTRTIGAWLALNSRLTLDLNYATSSLDAGALWILGEGAASSNLPHLAPYFAPLRTDNKQWAAGLTCAVGKNSRIYGRYLQSTSHGSTIFSVLPGDHGDLETAWQPFDVKERRWTLGYAWNVSSKHKLNLDFSLGDWNDGKNPANNGRFTMWRLAWTFPL